MVLYISSGKR